MRLPNFLIIGTAKAGTTAIYEYIKQHPQVFMSPTKEPHFFTFEGENLDFGGPRDQEILAPTVVTDFGHYKSLFAQAQNEIALGEVSTSYLYSPEAPERIKKYLPYVKLIIVLRNPIDRAYSSFLHMVREGREPCTNFRQALDQEQWRIQNNWEPLWHYKEMGLYYHQLCRYLESFDNSKIKICFFSDFKSNSVKFIRDLCKFLEISEDFTPDVSLKHNVSGLPKNQVLHSFLQNPSAIKSLSRLFLPQAIRQSVRVAVLNKNLSKSPDMSITTRSYLAEYYQDDVSSLQELTKTDLSNWLKT